MENNVIAVFNNRNKSMQFAGFLKRMGIANRTINTPRELSVSCGVSVVFNSNALNRVREMIYKLRLQMDVRMFLIKSNPIKKYIPI